MHFPDYLENEQNTEYFDKPVRDSVWWKVVDGDGAYAMLADQLPRMLGAFPVN